MAPGRKKRKSALLEGQTKLSFERKDPPPPPPPPEAGASRPGEPQRAGPSRALPGALGPAGPASLSPPRPRRTGRRSDPGAGGSGERSAKSTAPVASVRPLPSAPGRAELSRPRRQCSRRRQLLEDSPQDEPTPEKINSDYEDDALWSPTRNAEGEYS